MDEANPWDMLAQIWELCEPMGFNVQELRNLWGYVASPVLVVGAGQGLLLEALRSAGHAALGVDSSNAMVVRARERRGLDISLARAEALPFGDGEFQCLIVATGVLDRSRIECARRSLSECIRVLRRDGTLLMGFFAPSEEVCQIAQSVGYFIGRKQDQQRMVALWSAGHKPDSWARLTAAWTQRTHAEARDVIATCEPVIEQLVLFFDNVAELLALRGQDPVGFLRGTDVFSYHGFTDREVYRIVCQARLDVIDARRDLTGTTLIVAARPTG